ncbi:hypothetical protein DdX_19168 [Ditylenchus destructor]|uniref:F-box domain-containing protein n=1 Tax=Ditylenchus destructor TaxID=166010 RepID=A0AAD4QUC9_9BILA|nr:hypothetical protein DdX_19168 [Ditylenchus destructor]
MFCSKPLPPFTYELLYILNRDQLERFSIVCRPLKNLIERYFHSKPYRVFESLWTRGGSCALFHKGVQWYPNRDDNSVQQFLLQLCAELTMELYGTDHGILSQQYSRNQIEPSSSQFISKENVPDKEISLRVAVGADSLSGGQGHKHCNCVQGCKTGKCNCRSLGRLCNSRCHNSTSCKNK